jgi:methionyl-tRNA synthetase
MDKKKVLVTTAIDYANDVVHIGHAYEKILADATARYFRQKLDDKSVFFCTGTDEHGTTNEKAAEKRGITPQEHVDEISAKDKEQADALQVSYNRFVRTTDEDHKKIAAEIFAKAVATGDVYKAKYEGFYCEGCETHKTLSDLTEDGQCPLHPTRQIQKLEEENYFFKWSKYSDFLRELVSSSDFVLPERKRNEMLAMIDAGLKDKPVSRPKNKVSWGIDVPGDPEQVLYVWYDALVNYYTVGSQTGFWDEDTRIIHFVGKDIATFHVLLWPAMLKNVGLRVPDSVYVHGFVNLDGEKISKSKGNVIRPSDLVEKYGVDPIRYYFLKHGPITDDVSISIKSLEEVYNADLANGLGNTVSRIARLAEKSGFDFGLDEVTIEFDTEWDAPFKEFRVDLVLQNIWKIISDLEKHINDNAPWAITDDVDRLKEVLSYEVFEIRRIAKLLRPFIPETAKKISEQFANENIKYSSGLFPRLS